MCQWCNATPAWALPRAADGCRITHSRGSPGRCVRAWRSKQFVRTVRNAVFHSPTVTHSASPDICKSEDATLGSPYVVYNLVAETEGTQKLKMSTILSNHFISLCLYFCCGRSANTLITVIYSEWAKQSEWLKLRVNTWLITATNGKLYRVNVWPIWYRGVYLTICPCLLANVHRLLFVTCCLRSVQLSEVHLSINDYSTWRSARVILTLTQ